jgi:hypothetical protein
LRLAQGAARHVDQLRWRLRLVQGLQPPNLRNLPAAQAAFMVGWMSESTATVPFDREAMTEDVHVGIHVLFKQHAASVHADELGEAVVAFADTLINVAMHMLTAAHCGDKCRAATHAACWIFRTDE